MRPLNYLASKFRLNAGILSSFGVRNAMHFKMQQFRMRFCEPNSPLYLKTADAKHPLMCRPNTSDLHVFNQVFVERSYSCLDTCRDVHFIVDCGANVGYASAYLLSHHPNAVLVAIEPDSGNFEILKQNLKPYGARAVAIHAAVWSHSAMLTVNNNFGDGREWARSVTEDPCLSGAQVPAITIDSLLLEYSPNELSILKVDIEGAELAVFGGGTNWLPMTKAIAIELHGDKCKEVFFGKVTSPPYSVSQHGEVTLCVRPR